MGDHRALVRQAAILVGGRGTRLGGLTDTTPKPLLPCGDRPFLAWVLRELTRFGIEEVLLLTGYLGETVQASLPAIRRTLPKPLRITCIPEAQPAGTGGALYNARAHLAEYFLLCNGDSWLDCNLGRLFFDASGDSACVLGRMLLRRLDDASRYGVVATEGDRVTTFRERPDAGAAAAALPGTINAGVYMFDRRVLADVAPACSLERDVMPALAARGALRGTVAQGYFIDIGIPDDLRRSQTELPERLQRPALFVEQVLVARIHRPAGDIGGPFDLLSESVPVLRNATEAGWHVFLFDSGQATGADAADKPPAALLSAQIGTALRAQGAVIDDLCDAGFGGRPGASGLDAALANALARWDLDPSRCRLVGTADSVLGAASAVGIPASRVTRLSAFTLGD